VTQFAEDRTTPLVDRSPSTDGSFVLYWMIAQRRLTWNFGLQRAAEWAKELRKPLVVFEALSARYRWASDRLHRFVIDGMADNAARLSERGICHYPYVEPAPDAGRGLLEALAAHAAVVVTDDYPAFMLPRMVATAAQRVAVRFEQVDGNGLLPIRLTGDAFTSAYAFRRHLQRALPAHIRTWPSADPLSVLPRTRAILPPDVLRRWPAADPGLLAGTTGLGTLPIDHGVTPTALRGGSTAADAALERFLSDGLRSYAASRNDLEQDVTSGVSPYLHFGHLSSHAVVHAVLQREGWLGHLTGRATGARAGWWGVGAAAEAFLDQVVTWRELGFNMCAARPQDYDRYESLPGWARATLDAHAGDEREHVYQLAAFEAGCTHDPLWNAAQGQLVRDGRIHNYLRMLWGKKILEWTASPQEALAIMIELNNKYALDGRDPNSYSGIFWTLGRYDRAWGPERSVFGTVRYMSSANTARKMRVKEYIARYAPDARIDGQGSLW
jgi:deoxyribodipyrimidine photo-lyase